MRQDSRYRTDARSDYMQFSQFLENARATRENGSAGCGQNHTDNNGGCYGRTHADNNDGCGCGRTHADNNGGCYDRTLTDNSGGCCGRTNGTNHDRTRASDNGTGCCTRNDGCPVGMVYGIDQMWRDIYELETGFPRGTIFKELDLPLYRTGCNDKGGCRG